MSPNTVYKLLISTQYIIFTKPCYHKQNVTEPKFLNKVKQISIQTVPSLRLVA